MYVDPFASVMPVSGVRNEARVEQRRLSKPACRLNDKLQDTPARKLSLQARGLLHAIPTRVKGKALALSGYANAALQYS